MQPHRNKVKSHPARDLLNSYVDHGCPVDCGPNWSKDQLEEALKYGAHPSAQQKEALKCLIQEACDKEKEDFIKIITWGSIKNNIPKKLKLSPIAMIPHKCRKFQAVLDLSFHLCTAAAKPQGKSVNNLTTILSNCDTMNQLGNALQRILATFAKPQTQNKNYGLLSWT